MEIKSFIYKKRLFKFEKNIFMLPFIKSNNEGGKDHDEKCYFRGGLLSLLLLANGCSSRQAYVDHEYLGHVPSLSTVDSERNSNGWNGHTRLTTIPAVTTIGEATLYNASELKKHIPNLSNNIVVTSLVDVDDLRQSSDFGRLYSDSMITNFKRLGWNVIDFRGVKLVAKTKKGELYLDRGKLKNTPKDSVVFVGTYGQYSTKATTEYSESNNGLLINVRLLDKMTNEVISASNVQLNDKRAYALSTKSNCTTLGCSKTKGLSQEESDFNMMLKNDDCKEASRCELVKDAL